MVENIEELYALIGNPLEHSFSPDYFNRMFRENNINATYEPLVLKSISDLPEKLVEHPALRGFNVTLPYKKEILKFLDYVEPLAQSAGAVNTVKVVHHNGSIRLEGYNTDIKGFQIALTNFLTQHSALESYPRKALILGTGGAALAVKAALDGINIESLTVTRTSNRTDSLKHRKDLIEYKNLTPELIFEHQLIVNATPVGMFPQIMKTPPFPWEYITRHHFFFDLIYNPEETLAMKIAKAHGAKVSNGLEMLYAQADESWKIWQT